MRTKTKKAVSITISAVLLVVFVTAIAMLYSGWFKSFIRSISESAEKQDLPVNCDNVKVSIQKVTYGVVDKLESYINKTFLHDKAYEESTFNLTLNNSNVEVTIDLTPIPY